MGDNGAFSPNVTVLATRAAQLRMVEALLFAATEPLDVASIAARMPDGCDVPALLSELQNEYAKRGVNLARVGDGWRFRTADDLSFLLRQEQVEQKKLSRAALETLAIVAYHQPVTRAEIEEIRGVSISRGVLDVLLETGWIRMRGRRRTPGRPVTYGTTPGFLDHFGLENVRDLPGMDELKAAGLLQTEIPENLKVPSPSDDEALAPDEDPLEEDDVNEELASISDEDEPSAS
ncbi:MAG: SMC-Scp complex subunit ScpB [Rhodobiaceae bacterium]|nr:SMC-Scp complex subunit ScpB [Rhodobiaceae bacterium]MCC0018878.1 SMC-Scp complex subunit ScpB [Rhodobiaceae bacterium]MCC0051691.1 SMC-Scp complex subunit ScpB [Rhodobiaceae bacterium]MCC0060727.1 SMC-Scp complex subunit ScpB [Rhodobiaceae bacterium]